MFLVCTLLHHRYCCRNTSATRFWPAVCVPLFQQFHPLLQWHSWSHLPLPLPWSIFRSTRQLGMEQRTPLSRWVFVSEKGYKPDHLKTQSEDWSSQFHWWLCLLHLLPSEKQYSWSYWQCNHIGRPTRWVLVFVICLAWVSFPCLAIKCFSTFNVCTSLHTLSTIIYISCKVLIAASN